MYYCCMYAIAKRTLGTSTRVIFEMGGIGCEALSILTAEYFSVAGS